MMKWGHNREDLSRKAERHPHGSLHTRLRPDPQDAPEHCPYCGGDDGCRHCEPPRVETERSAAA